MMYASKIEIKREPQEIDYHIQVVLPEGLLSLKMLSCYVKKDESFYISEIEGRYTTELILTIPRKRLEIQEELDKRVVREEKYMEGYYKHHAKYKKG